MNLDYHSLLNPISHPKDNHIFFSFSFIKYSNKWIWSCDHQWFTTMSHVFFFLSTKAYTRNTINQLLYFFFPLSLRRVSNYLSVISSNKSKKKKNRVLGEELYWCWKKKKKFSWLCLHRDYILTKKFHIKKENEINPKISLVLTY